MMSGGINRGMMTPQQQAQLAQMGNVGGGMGGSMMPQQGNVGAMSGMGGGGFPGSGGNTVSPTHPSMAQMSGGGGGSGGMGSMDPRMMSGNIPGSGAGGIGGPGGMTPHQRQLMLLQQQQRTSGGMQGGIGGIGIGAGGMPGGSGMPGPGGPQFNNINGMGNIGMGHPRMPQMGGGASSPTHANSPMGSDGGLGFHGGPPNTQGIRSASAIPGIARSMRSPSDGAPSPQTPQGGLARVGSLGQDEYQRMMQQQQQQQAVRAMSSQSAGFNQQMSGMGQQMAQMQGYGMSPPSSTSGTPFGGGGGGGISAPSPTSGGGQNWGTPAQGGYPFAPSPAGSDHARHMSATPVSQQQTQMTPQSSPPADPMLSGDFDLFNWNG